MIGGQLGTPGDDIDAVTAWDQTEGAGVTVAVVDTGIASDARRPGRPDRHQCRRGRRRARGRRRPQRLRRRRPRLGLRRPRQRRRRTATATAPTSSGTIVGRGQNTFGVVGVAPQAKILPLRVLDNDGTGWTSDIANAFDYAGDQGVRIVNASLGGGRSDAIEDAIAEHPNTLYVVAAGNDGADADTDRRRLPVRAAAGQPDLRRRQRQPRRDRRVLQLRRHGGRPVRAGRADLLDLQGTASYGFLGRHVDGLAACRRRRRARAVAAPGRLDRVPALLAALSVDAVPGWDGLVGHRRAPEREAARSTRSRAPSRRPTPTPTPEPPVETPTPEPPGSARRSRPVAPTPDRDHRPGAHPDAAHGQRLAARQGEQAARLLPPLAQRLGALHGPAEGLADRVSAPGPSSPRPAATRC